MKKAFLGLVAFGVLVGVVLVAWELVAAPGPMRKAWWAFKAYKNPVYQTKIQFPLKGPISEEQRAAENQLLDRMDLLLPLVEELGLREELGAPDDTAAAVRLAEASNLRRVPDELMIELYVQSPDKEFLQKVTTPLAKAYLEKRAAVGRDGKTNGGGF